MGYMHIDNLYKNTEILLFRECYALEKIHGTSAHIRWNDGKVGFNSGGEKHDKFVGLFDVDYLDSKFRELFLNSDVVVYGEAYGGKCQGMSAIYGKELKFVVFDVCVDGLWLNVPNAEDVAVKLGLEFVDYLKISTDIDSINYQRDRFSVQAVRNGCGESKVREGVVLRPLIEVRKNNDERVIVKHKGEAFLETKTMREVNPEQLLVLQEAEAIASEWVTEMRLSHILDKLGNPSDIARTGDVIKAMIGDVFREGEGEFVVSKSVSVAIGKHTARLYKKRISKLEVLGDE